MQIMSTPFRLQGSGAGAHPRAGAGLAARKRRHGAARGLPRAATGPGARCGVPTAWPADAAGAIL